MLQSFSVCVIPFSINFSDIEYLLRNKLSFKQYNSVIVDHTFHDSTSIINRLYFFVIYLLHIEHMNCILKLLLCISLTTRQVPCHVIDKKSNESY